MFFIRLIVITLLLGGVTSAAISAPLDFTICDSYESKERARKCHAKARGLSPRSNWDEISLHDGEMSRQQIAQDLQLQVNSSWESIIEATKIAEAEKETKAIAEAEKARLESIHVWEENNRFTRATELGLPSDSTWKQINERLSDLSRQDYAIENGLPINSSWEVIQKRAWEREIAFWKAKGINIVPPLTNRSITKKKKRR